MLQEETFPEEEESVVMTTVSGGGAFDLGEFWLFLGFVLTRGRGGIKESGNCKIIPVT